MGVDFTRGERCALYSLLEEGANDIFLKTDRSGFIVHASPAFMQFGFALQQLLFGPHLADLVHASQREAVRSAHRAALMGFEREDWIEFRAASGEQRGKWFELQMRCLRDAGNRIAGTLGMVRSIEERRALEDRLFAAEMTCPLTGLTNRKAFVAMLSHLIAEQQPGSLAIFSVDYLKAINLRHGQSTGDEVLVVFADYLRAMLRSQDIISRFGGQSLAVLLPGTDEAEAEAVCRTLIETLSQLGGAAPDGIPITASAGVGPIGPSLDATIKRAELALVHARAKGRNRLERAPRTAARPLSWAA
jgi:diguanylate cyclase (GGDEF)-like protein/PAS domain S-box-containing protein